MNGFGSQSIGSGQFIFVSTDRDFVRYDNRLLAAENDRLLLARNEPPLRKLVKVTKADQWQMLFFAMDLECELSFLLIPTKDSSSSRQEEPSDCGIPMNRAIAYGRRGVHLAYKRKKVTSAPRVSRAS